jgi:hypothetical protein
MSARSRFATSCLVAASLAVVACGSDNGSKPTDAGVPDAPKGPVLGGKLGAALASAEAAASSAAPAKDKAKDGDQPPETGVFADGEADKRQPRGAPPKIEVISEGLEPRVQLVTRPDVPEQKTTIGVTMRMGQGRLPNIDFSLAIKPDTAKADKPKAGDKPKDEKPAEAAAGAPVHMAATVVGTSLPSTQGIPKELLDTIAKLKGTVIHYDLSAAGAGSNYAIELPKAAGEGLELVLDALVDALSMFTVALPSKPIGKDGYWLASDRAKTAAGIEVVRYRVFKVQKIDNGAVTLTMTLRQYSADQKLKIDAGPQKGELGIDGFESQGTGTVIWKADSFLPMRGDMNERVLAKLSTGPGAPPAPRGQGPAVQTELTGTLGGGTGVPTDEKP